LIDFDIELAVEEMEARAGSAVGEDLLARWRAHVRGEHASTALPTWLGGVTARQRLERLRTACATDSTGLARRLEMLSRLHLGCAVESSAEVRAAWQMLGEADDGGGVSACRGMRALFAARNRAARELGWPGFFAVARALGELDDCDPEARLRAADLATREPWRAARCVWRSEPAAELEREVPEVDPDRALGFLAWLGLPMAGVRVDLTSGQQSAVARTYPVAPPHDVRVVASRGRSVACARELWHELGHAAYAASAEPGTPWSIATAPARCLDEAVAEVFADLGESETYLLHHLGIPATEVAPLRQRRRIARLVWQRWQLARAALERDAYRDPEGDLDARWHGLVREYVGEQEARAARSWTEVSHLRTDPGSQLDYLVADEIRRVLGEQLLGGNGRELARGAGQQLCARVLRVGAIHRWREVVGDLGLRVEV